MHTIFVTKEDLIRRSISKDDVVLDVGFWGQGVTTNDAHWPHRIIHECAQDVYGLDLVYDEALVPFFKPDHYFKCSAESFILGKKFDVIFAGDLIEHLSNPGLFLASCKEHLAPGGRLVIVTPNCYNLFDMAGKITRFEPVVNHDHTCYFNVKTLRQLLAKNGWEIASPGFLYAFGTPHRQSIKKRVLNGIYHILGLFTPKYFETMAVIATPTTHEGT